MGTNRLSVFVLLAGLQVGPLTPRVGPVPRPQNPAESPEQPSAITPNASGVLRLDIYNFTLAGSVDRSQPSQVLQEAIPDSLFLGLLHEPKVDPRRIRDAFTPALTPPGKTLSEGRVSETKSLYVLDGTVGLVDASIGTPQTSDRFSPPSLLILKYWLRKVGESPSPSTLIEGHELTTLSQLSVTLSRISEQVITRLVPPSKVSLRIVTPQLRGFPISRQSFYADNLLDIMQTELQSQVWIDVAQTAQKSDYTLTESVRIHEGKYESKVTILGEGDRPEGAPLEEHGRETEVLAGQLRLARRILETLKTRRDLASAGADTQNEPSADTYLHAASTYESTDLDTAIVLYTRAVELDSSNTDAKESLASAYLKQGNGNGALKVLQGADVEKSPWGQLLRSLAFALLQDTAKAMDAANRAVTLDPGTAVGHWWRGHLFAGQGDSAKALRDYETALVLDPKDPDYYVAASHASEDVGDFDNAVKTLETAHDRLPDDPNIKDALNESRRRAAVHFLETKDPVSANRFALASVTDDSGSEWGQRLVGISYHRMGNLPEAVKSLELALAIKTTEQSLTELAEIRVEQGDKSTARTLAEKAIEVDEDASAPYVLLENAATDPADAKETVAWLKAYAAKSTNPRSALEVWDYLQLSYLPDDPSELSQLYSAYEAATKSVPYASWTGGWENLVELAMINGKWIEAEAIASQVLKAEPRVAHQLDMVFYLWVLQSLQGECERFMASQNELTELLSRDSIVESQNSWEFAGTRRYLNNEASHGILDQSFWVTIQSAMQILESHPMEKNAIELFLKGVRSQTTAPCKVSSYRSIQRCLAEANTDECLQNLFG